MTDTQVERGEDANDDIEWILDTFGADVTRCAAALEAGDDAFTRRQYIRAVFAMQEALTFAVKQSSLTAHQAGDCEFTAGEISMLAEIAYDLTDKGEIFERPAIVTPLKNIRFAFSTFARAHRCSFQLDVSDARWDLLRRAVQVRNRLMHPKTPRDAEVSDDDLTTVRDAHHWLIAQYHAVHEEAARVLLAQAKAARLRGSVLTLARERAQNVLDALVKGRNDGSTESAV